MKMLHQAMNKAKQAYEQAKHELDVKSDAQAKEAALENANAELLALTMKVNRLTS